MAKIKINNKQKALIESVALAFGTCNKQGKPNVVAVACVKVVDQDKILITDNFFNKTRKNLLENKNVALTVWNKEEEYGYQFKGPAEYFTEGKWKEIVDEMEENKGLAHKAAVLVTVKEVYKL
ncbi:pyridoxamine 5'-phosphate oxidase family protein [Candidatus Dojkabacteria bacterium]|nr:pyridoxamine 5'-phosphate oxidase family protein [Candidatus Dojkabacteria bacterium]